MSSINPSAIATILLLSLAVVAAHLFPGLDNSRVESGVRNGLHLVVFAVFAVIVFDNLKQKGILQAVVFAVVGVALIGSASEFVQFLSGRNPDMMDIARDLTGATLALAARLLWLRASRNGTYAIYGYLQRSASILLAVSIVVPLLCWSSIIASGKMASPAILDFEQWWNKYTYRPVNADIVVPQTGAGSLQLELHQRGRSGLIVSPMMTDWSGFQFLIIDAGMLRGPAANVTVRINDRERKNVWTDQFMSPTVFETDSSVIRIPLGELAEEQGQPSMDLADIQEIVIFARDRRRDTAMLIEDIRLE